MKKILSLILAGALCIALATPAFAYNYQFSSGGDTLPGFGSPTSNDNPVSANPTTSNERRNKDAALLPPPYFYGSGDFPTDTASPYHDNTPGGANSGYNAGTSGNSTSSPPGSSVSTSLTPGFEASTSTVAANTVPKYYADGSIGTITVQRFNLTIKVYEGEQLENLRKGAGHFSMTSAWDGNVSLAGHNRGASPFFSFVKDMKAGDKVTYTTLYGSRTYEVYNVEQIGEYDYSKLAWSAENRLTLITCVENTPEVRWAASLREVR